MSIALLERAAAALGELVTEVTFVGGASITLWITDPAAPAPRATKDVDVVVEVASRYALHEFEQRLREREFREDADSNVICRWRHGKAEPEDDLILDVIPADATLVGFTNRWFREAVPAAGEHRLPSGVTIRAVSPPYLVATKLEAFAGRGRGDHLGSRDLDDIVTLVDGREELAAEIASSDAGLREYLTQEVSALLAEARFVDAVYGFVRPDISSQARVDALILPRLRDIASDPGRRQ